jgi:hypothetical protein
MQPNRNLNKTHNSKHSPRQDFNIISRKEKKKTASVQYPKTGCGDNVRKNSIQEQEKRGNA